MKRKMIFWLIVILFSLTACVKTSSNKVVPTPQPGEAVVIGKVFASDGSNLSNSPVRLAEVYRSENNSGAFALDEATSPSTMTDENGEYVFLNIVPGEYVMVVGSINTKYMIIANPDGTAIVQDIKPDVVTEIEPITVNYK